MAQFAPSIYSNLARFVSFFQEFSGIFRNIQQISKGLIKRFSTIPTLQTVHPVAAVRLGFKGKKIDTFSNGVYMLLRLSVTITNDDTDYDDV